MGIAMPSSVVATKRVITTKCLHSTMTLAMNGRAKMNDTNPCIKCGFWDSDYEGCTCPHSDKWYACPIENKKPENIHILKEYCEDVRES